MAYEIARTIVSGRKSTNVATPVAIVSSNIQCFMVLLTADGGNASPIVIGNADVVAANGSQKGVVLTPGNPPIMFLIKDVSSIYLDVQTNGDAVCFVYFAI